MGWERLAHVELSSDGDTLDSGTFTAKKNLKVIVYLKGTADVTRGQYRFNTDTGSNYASRRSSNGGSDGTDTSDTSLQFTNQMSLYSAYTVTEIINISNEEKFCINHTTVSEATGAGTAPARHEVAGKWTNTSDQITRIQVYNDDSGDYEAGSYITVFGAKEPATANVMTVDGFTAKENLKIQVYTKGGNGNKFTFNNDTGNNYAHRYQLNGGSDGTQTSRANFWSYYDGNDTEKFTTIYVTNILDKEKTFITENVSAVGTGAGTAPSRAETVGKWANTSAQITRFDASTFTTDGLEEGSEVIVWGSDGASDTTYPTLVGGYVFEESDTGKHYIFDGSNTWTEIG